MSTADSKNAVSDWDKENRTRRINLVINTINILQQSNQNRYLEIGFLHALVTLLEMGPIALEFSTQTEEASNKSTNPDKTNPWRIKKKRKENIK